MKEEKYFYIKGLFYGIGILFIGMKVIGWEFFIFKVIE